MNNTATRYIATATHSHNGKRCNLTASAIFQPITARNQLPAHERGNPIADDFTGWAFDWGTQKPTYFTICPVEGNRVALRGEPVKGRYSNSHECDVKCEEASSAKCTCSCSGINHGASHTETA